MRLAQVNASSTHPTHYVGALGKTSFTGQYVHALVPASRDKAARLFEVSDCPDQVPMALASHPGHGIVEIPHGGVLVQHGCHQQLVNRVDVETLQGGRACAPIYNVCALSCNACALSRALIEGEVRSTYGHP